MSNIGILAYGSLIEDPGQELLPLIEKRIHTKTPFAVEFARLSRKRGSGPTLVPFEHGVNVNAQILLLQAGTTIEQATDMLYRRETGNLNAHYLRPAEAAITVNTVLIDHLTNFEHVQTVLYTRIGSNIPHLTPEVLAQSAVASAKSQAGADRSDGINYLISVKRMGIKTNLSLDYENAVLQLTNTSNLEEAYLKCRSGNMVKSNLALFIPALLDFVNLLEFPWDRIDNLFTEKIEERKQIANGETIMIEATIFDIIVSAKKGNSTAIGYLNFLNRLFEELTDNLTLVEKRHIQTNITNMLTRYDKGYWGYVAEIATLNNLIKSKSYTLIGSEVRVDGTNPIDFKLRLVGNNSEVYVEVLSIHLDSDRVNPDPPTIKTFLTGRILKKIGAKKINVEENPNLYLVPVLWGDQNSIKIYSDFFKSNTLDLKNVIEPLSYITYSDDNGHYEHYFKTISNLFKSN